MVASGTPDSLGGPQARLPVVHWEHAGQRHSERTAHPTALVNRLAKELAPDGGEVPGLRVERPSLEEIYLGLIAASGPDDGGAGAASPPPQPTRPPLETRR